MNHQDKSFVLTFLAYHVESHVFCTKPSKSSFTIFGFFCHFLLQLACDKGTWNAKDGLSIENEKKVLEEFNGRVQWSWKHAFDNVKHMPAPV